MRLTCDTECAAYRLCDRCKGVETGRLEEKRREKDSFRLRSLTVKKIETQTVDILAAGEVILHPLLLLEEDCLRITLVRLFVLFTVGLVCGRALLPVAWHAVPRSRSFDRHCAAKEV